MLFTLIFDQPLLGLTVVFAIIIALVWHEVSHGVVALWLGDTTAKDEGRLNFNPFRHLDPMGTILLLFVGFGWAKPVPVNYYNLKYPKWGPALVAAAGPASHLLLIIVCALVYKITTPQYNPLSFADDNLMILFLSYLIFFNIILMIFNLIPIPPLDGSKILFALLPSKYEEVKIWLSTRGPMLLFGVIMLDIVFNTHILSTLFSWVLAFFAMLFG